MDVSGGTDGFVAAYQPPRVASVSKRGCPGAMYVTGFGFAYGYRSWVIRSSVLFGPGTRYSMT
jgi:hypothetical protein